MSQRSLFEKYRDVVAPCDPNVNEDDERRLTGQNGAILARLRAGPATNVELAQLALKYTSRISDLRAAGYVIPEPERCHGGVTVYKLIE